MGTEKKSESRQRRFSTISSSKRPLERFAFSLIGLVAFVLVSGGVLMALERPRELERSRAFFSREDAVNEFLDVLESGSIGDREDLAQNVSVLRQHLASLNDCAPACPEHLNWDYGSCVFYSVTVITTIGYGSFATQTAGGQAFVCFLCTFGVAYLAHFLAISIRLVQIPLHGLSQRVLRGRWVKAWIERRGWNVTVELATLVLVVVFALAYIALFAATATWTGWSYSQSVYFAVVTFTTVGLGDLAPTNSDFARFSSDAYLGGALFIFTVLLILGLTILAIVLNAMQQHVTRVSLIAVNRSEKFGSRAVEGFRHVSLVHLSRTPGSGLAANSKADTPSPPTE